GTGKQVALAARDATDCLDHRVEAAPRRPGPDVAERAERNENDARPQLCQRLGREATSAEGAWPVALREHVGLADEPSQGFEIFRLAQIEMCCELAVAGVVFLIAEIRKVRPG